jgi:DNA-binding HxlR family transcriptional regulator
MDEYMFNVLTELDEEEKTFANLKTLNMSPSTTLSRLREAQSKGWVENKLVPRKGKKPKITYVLTKEGKEIIETFSSILPQYSNLREEVKELQKAIREKEKKIHYLLSSVKRE